MIVNQPTLKVSNTSVYIDLEAFLSTTLSLNTNFGYELCGYNSMLNLIYDKNTTSLKNSFIFQLKQN